MSKGVGFGGPNVLMPFASHNAPDVNNFTVSGSWGKLATDTKRAIFAAKNTIGQRSQKKQRLATF